MSIASASTASAGAARSAQGRSPYLDLRGLAALTHMRFAPRGRIDGAYSGRHRSRQQGGAGEFVDFREYGGGEDLRRLDWKVYARTGKAFVRLHEEETNLLCTLAIDASESMNFPAGARRDEPTNKLIYARYLSTALAHLVALGQDQVGLALLADEADALLAPGGTMTHLARLHEAVAEFRPRKSTTMSGGLRQLFESTRRGGVLVLMSDFLMDDLEQVFARLRMFRHSRWEIMALHLVHPEEERLPEGAAFRFRDMEGSGSEDCTPNEIRAEYEQKFAAHLAMVRQMALAVGCDYRLVSTAIPYLQTLRGMLIPRSG